MNWPIREYTIGKLYLDQFNIRTPISLKDQNALIRDMFANEQAFDIAVSFVQNGLFPDEFPIVVEETGKVIVIEGNRRLAALKVLNEPDIVPAWKKRINGLQNPKIKSIRVVVAPSRVAAMKHIANKHTIDLRRPWKPLRQAYFYQSQIDNGRVIDELISEFPEHKIPRFIKMLDMHHLAKSMEVEEALISRIHDDRNFPITTLERFYNDTYVSEFLGIEFDPQGKVKGKIDKNEFEKGFKRLIEDIALGDIDSRKSNSALERQKYIENIPMQSRPDLTKKGVFGAGDYKALSAIPETKKTKKSSKKNPQGLFFQADIPFNISSTSLRLMYNELRDINVEDFPNATHDLLRSFLECTLVFYLKETGEFGQVKKHESHNPNLSEMLSFISSENCISIDDSNIKAVVKQMKTDWGSAYSVERMNMINHNENWTSSGKEVRVAWGKIESLFKVLLSPKKI